MLTRAQLLAKRVALTALTVPYCCSMSAISNNNDNNNPTPPQCAFSSQMKLQDKGPYKDPPTLPRHAQRLVETISAWPGVHTRAHWAIGSTTIADGTDFYIGQDELGHIHISQEAHMPNSLPIADLIVESGLAPRFFWDKHFCWRKVNCEQEVARTETLFRLRYDMLRGEASEQQIADRIRVAAGHD